MKDWKKVQGSQETKPAEFDTTSSPTTVYQRRNVQRVTVSNGDGTTSELWEYAERTMTHEEFAALLAQMDAERLENELTDVQMALTELYEMMGV
jgi:hypothetical protein